MKPGRTFFRDLVLLCLDYVPGEAEGARGHPDVRALRSVGGAVNAVRSDLYSWLVAAVAGLPEEAFRQSERLAAELRCLRLDDRGEELLLLCAVLVQVAHVAVMRFKCFECVDVAAGCLGRMFDEREGGWEAFERHCRAKGPEGEAQRLDPALLRDETPWCTARHERNVLGFWDKGELRRVARVAQEERETMQRFAGLQGVVVVRTYNSYLRRRVEGYEYEGPREGEGGCSPTCLGCRLNALYPRGARVVRHHLFCRGACEVARLPERVLDFVQEQLDFVFGSCVLKRVRNRTFQELNVETETCVLCKGKCIRKLIVCMDVLLERCGR